MKGMKETKLSLTIQLLKLAVLTAGSSDLKPHGDLTEFQVGRVQMGYVYLYWVGLSISMSRLCQFGAARLSAGNSSNVMARLGFIPYQIPTMNMRNKPHIKALARGRIVQGGDFWASGQIRTLPETAFLIAQ